jgi:hypothetical protein
MGGLFCLLEFGNIDLLHALMLWNPLTKKIEELCKLESFWFKPLVWHMFGGCQTTILQDHFFWQPKL